VKSLQVKAANGGKCAVAKGDKLRQIRCRLLSLFVAQVRLRHFDLYDRKGMVSRKNQGFQVSESRQNHVQVNVSNRMTMGAVNVRF